ncbi:hypothetical protein [Herbaspirillum sp. CF444]|uniref:hypothetical protein n=1 Tax=Herbaspirillum sp. CF444 TaxID=1144319 RepID=UPI0012FAEC42|nr:hypothetical protein [Herbaspirillum sp. CF444]
MSHQGAQPLFKLIAAFYAVINGHIHRNICGECCDYILTTPTPCATFSAESLLPMLMFRMSAAKAEGVPMSAKRSRAIVGLRRTENRVIHTRFNSNVDSDLMHFDAPRGVFFFTDSA